MARERVIFERTVAEALRIARITHPTKTDLSHGVATAESYADSGDTTTLAAAEAYAAAGDVATLAAAEAHDTDALLSTSDIATNNVSSAKHGFAPKAPADATKFLNGAATPAYAQVKDSDLSTSDIATNNVSTAKHGFAPKLPNDATKYLDGTGAYSTPAGSGSSLPTFPAITGIKLRLSAALSAITIAAADKRVSAVTDLSGNGLTAVQATLANQPKYLPKGFNGGTGPCLYFDGAASFLKSTFSLAQPFSVVLVLQNYQGGTSNENLYRDGAGGGAVGFISGGNTWAIFAGTSLASATLFTQNRALVPIGDTSNAAVRIDVYDGANSLIGNNSVETALAAAGASGITTQLFIGADGSTSFAKAYLYEFLVIDHALTAPERALLYAYYDAAVGCGL